MGFPAALCFFVCVTSAHWSREGEEAWVGRIYDIYKDNAAEELDVIPNSGSARYFPRQLLDRCADGKVPVRRWEFPDEFLRKSDLVKQADIRTRFRSDVEPSLRRARGRIYVGLDFARSGDLSLYWVLDQTAAECRTLMILEVRNCPFREQELTASLILSCAEKSGKLGGMAVDSRGNGQSLAENLSLDFPGAAAGVMETAAWYAEWFPKLKAWMEDGGVTLPADEAVLGDFSVVTLRNGSPRIPDERTKDRDGKSLRHGDGAAAAVLACYAVSECAANPPPLFEPAKRRERKKVFGLF